MMKDALRDVKSASLAAKPTLLQFIKETGQVTGITVVCYTGELVIKQRKCGCLQC